MQFYAQLLRARMRNRDVGGRRLGLPGPLSQILVWIDVSETPLAAHALGDKPFITYAQVKIAINRVILHGDDGRANRGNLVVRLGHQGGEFEAVADPKIRRDLFELMA